MLLLALSALLVDGVVVDQQSAWEGGLIVTRSTVETDDGEIVVRHAGGEVDGIGQILSHTPWISLGERVKVEVAPRGDELALVAKESLVSYFVRTTTQSSNPPCSGTEVHPLFWNRVDVPFVLDGGGTPDVPFADAQAAIRASFATWQDIECSYLGFDDGGTVEGFPAGYDRTGPNRNLVTWVESGWTSAPTAIAVTVLTFACDDGEIFDADILLNGEEFVFTTTPETAADAHDIQNTVTHEVGHLVGFDHNPDRASTMYADAAPGETGKRDLAEDDITGLCEVYPVGDEPVIRGGCGPGPGSGAALFPLVALALVTSGRSRGRSSRRARRSP